AGAGGQGVGSVRGRGRVPGHSIRRARVFGAEGCAVEEELDAGDADVVRGGGRHRHRARDRRPVGGRRDTDGRRRGVGVRDRDGDRGGGGRVAGRVAGAGGQGVRSIVGGRRIPTHDVRRARVFG